MTRTSRPLASLAALASLLIAGAACRRHEPLASGDGLAAEASVESALISADQAALFSSALAGAPVTLVPATPDQVATYLADHIPGQYPACVTASVAGATVTVDFDGCTGPWGMTIIDGTVVFTVRPSLSGTITVDATATDLIVGGASLDLDATAVYTRDGATESIDVTSRTTGTGLLGNEIVHTGDFTVAWDATCASIDGAWSTTAGDAARSTSASLERCNAGCPTGSVVRDAFDGATITVTFDGTNVARWTSTRGRSGEIHFTCGS
jgi:hypothetical protein